MGSRHTKGRAFEQETGKFLLKYNGPCPVWGELTTDTGRTGQLTDLQVDTLSRTYATECKSGTHIPTTPFKWFKQIAEQAEKHGKSGMLALKVDGRSYKENVLHCITPARHAELLKKEREYDKAKD